MEAFTARTITEAQPLLRELNQVREQGYATAQEELEEGLNVVAVAIYDHDGQAVASVSVAGPSFRVTPEKFPHIADHLRQTAAEISRQLGYKGTLPVNPISNNRP
jgi:DNA-binding IclR family transcriptional regulator